METLSVSYLIPSVQVTSLTRRRSPYATSEYFPRISLFSRKVKKLIDYSHIITCSKRSVYQDFQDFVKPLHLLPATQATTYPMAYSKEIISSLELDQSTSLYMIELRTSRDFSSSLSDVNSGIMICLIDVNGRSILQRISAISQEKDEKISEYIHFQRGSVDTAAFKGPKLEQIAALWIGLESGSWRLDGVGVKVINGPTPSSSSTQYKFEADDVSLGDGGGLSVIELRPVLVTRSSSIDSSPEASDFDPELMRVGGMREYAALKFSLLLYDFILVVTGAGILAVSSNEANSYSFLAGGICGFLYLLLLQRSVDGLSAPSLSDEDDNEETSLRNYGANGPVVVILGSAIIAGIVLCKYWFGGRRELFSSSEIVVGVAGFLTSKMAVVIAAFKPVPINIENKTDRNNSSA